MSEGNKITINRMLPTVALRGMTVLPGAIIHFDLNREKSVAAIEQAMVTGGRVFLITQKNTEDNDPSFEQLYHVGTVALVKQITKLPNHVIRVLVEGIGRGLFTGINEENPEFIEAAVEEISGEAENDILGTDMEHKAQTEAMLRQAKEYFASYAGYYPKLGQNAMKRYADINNLGYLIDQMTMNMPLEYTYKQKVLEAVALSERYDVFCEILINEIEVAKIRTDLTQKIKGKVDKNQKEYLLREQLRYIREELGDDDSFSDADQFEESLSALQASEEVKSKIKKEIKRFKSLSQNSSESSVERAYIETLLELPWDRVSVDNESMKRAEEILNRDHYGLEKVKERILEFLAVRCLTKKGDSPILCLVGPPGTGKTSIAKSVAQALDKKYVRICLGGVRDEAEIRGHRKTYVGAMPGRLATGLRQAGVKNPLMLLDEIDKVSNDYKGDTFSALLEVLDSEQNVRFRDHYVEIPIDLSEVLFIATANTTETIPRPLLDRMEIIEVNSYTENEKFHIAKEHLLAKELKKNGLDKTMLSIKDSALKSIITYYTKEAGVRSLERKIGDICRKAAREILEERENGDEEIKRISVTASNLEKYLGKKKFSLEKADKKPQVGIVRGLAWTSVGGETLQIEVNMMPGKGDIDLTGQMGDVMKESAIIAMSYVRSISKEHGIKPEIFKENDFHIHIPEGAVPKDGPSAGVTMATAIFSTVTGRKVRSDIAMTGEITLRGRSLPIGGLKEKILAAKMAGVKEVLVPLENKKDIEEISDEIKEGLVITFVSNMKEILARALVEK
ncbi:MAG: endopeptidase La [Lachnospiraceae bacterium]|nr:endopeptidase La [Lachnospiraceae bacterium]MDD7628814.1 endopeptidase La [Lachnospiraceae bacterium]MDY4120308.1 endopeptidase La [Lachnospiraceae bacterium]